MLDFLWKNTSHNLDLINVSTTSYKASANLMTKSPHYNLSKKGKDC